ncbi:MAG TPA: MAPEG family protein [Acetobacteraceae bacterium]|nr:MAPEG family protein [Acetobacteraceae bacterium]
MVFPVITSFYAAILSLIFAALSVWVSIGRFHFNALHGDGGIETLNRRIRAHGNFAEYVPLILLLIALLEAGGTHPWVVRTLLLILVVARLMHPIGMVAPIGSLRQYAFRATSTTATWCVLIVSATLLLVRFA